MEFEFNVDDNENGARTCVIADLDVESASLFHVATLRDWHRLVTMDRSATGFFDTVTWQLAWGHVYSHYLDYTDFFEYMDKWADLVVSEIMKVPSSELARRAWEREWTST